MEVELGQVIAERLLRAVGSDGLDVRVLVGLPYPFRDEPYDNYLCPYQVKGLGDAKVRHATGVDAVQALELALRILPVQLDVLRVQHPGQWEDASAGDYGFSGPSLARERADEADGEQ